MIRRGFALWIAFCFATLVRKVAMGLPLSGWDRAAVAVVLFSGALVSLVDALRD